MDNWNKNTKIVETNTYLNRNENTMALEWLNQMAPYIYIFAYSLRTSIYVRKL